MSTSFSNEKCEIMNFFLLLSSLTKAKNEEVNNFFVSKKVLTYEHKTRRKAIFLFQLIFSLESNKSLIFGSSHQIDSYSAGFLCRFRNINDGKAHLSTGQTVLDAMASHFLPLTDKCKTPKAREEKKKRNEKIRIF